MTLPETPCPVCGQAVLDKVRLGIQLGPCMLVVCHLECMAALQREQRRDKAA